MHDKPLIPTLQHRQARPQERKPETSLRQLSQLRRQARYVLEPEMTERRRGDNEQRPLACPR